MEKSITFNKLPIFSIMNETDVNAEDDAIAIAKFRQYLIDHKR